MTIELEVNDVELSELKAFEEQEIELSKQKDLTGEEKEVSKPNGFNGNKVSKQNGFKGKEVSKENAFVGGDYEDLVQRIVRSLQEQGHLPQQGINIQILLNAQKVPKDQKELQF